MIAGAALFRFVNVGRRLVGELFEPFHRGTELLQERREQLQVASQRAALRARSPARPCCSARGSRRRCSRTRANGASARSESTASFASTLFSLARIASTLSNSRSAGLARRITSCRSLPRPASPAPSSLRMIVRRWRSGSRLMSPSRSTSTGLCVFCDGQQVLARAFVAVGDLVQRRRQRGARARAAASAGSRRTSRRSAPAGGLSQLASARKSLKPALSMFRTTAALAACGVGVTEATVPTFTPAILTFSPGMMLPASSKIARTL